VKYGRRAELELAVGLPEQVGAHVGIGLAADGVVQADDIGRDRQQRLAVLRDLDLAQFAEVALLVEADRRPGHAFVAVADHAVERQADRAGLAVALAHRRDMPGNQHLGRPALGVLGHRMRPVAVPLVLVADRAVGDVVRQRDHEVVAAAAVAVEVHVDVDAIDIAVAVALEALFRARHIDRLTVAEGDGQSLFGSLVPGLGRMTRGLAGQRLGHAEIVDALRIGPFRGIDPAVDLYREGRQGQREDQGERQCAHGTSRVEKVRTCWRRPRTATTVLSHGNFPPAASAVTPAFAEAGGNARRRPPRRCINVLAAASSRCSSSNRSGIPRSS
jgi:hypothetical protein